MDSEKQRPRPLRTMAAKNDFIAAYTPPSETGKLGKSFQEITNSEITNSEITRHRVDKRPFTYRPHERI